jgi:hypothetical protein
VLVFENGVSESKKISLDLKKRTITSLNFIQTPKPDVMIAAGTYCESEYAKSRFGIYNTVNGTYLFKFDLANSTILNKSINPFSNEIYGFMNFSEKEQKKKKSIKDIYLWDIKQSDNGDVTLSLEQKDTEDPNGFSNSGSSNMNTPNSRLNNLFVSKTIFVVNYDSSFTVKYQTFIPKGIKIAGSDYGVPLFGAYHILLRNKDKSALIFNDHKKNADKKMNDHSDISIAGVKGDNVVARMVTVNANGDKSSTVLFKGKDEDFILQPQIALQYSPNSIITLGIDNKKFKLIKIEY